MQVIYSGNFSNIVYHPSPMAHCLKRKEKKVTSSPLPQPEHCPLMPFGESRLLKLEKNKINWAAQLVLFDLQSVLFRAISFFLLYFFFYFDIVQDSLEVIKIAQRGPCNLQPSVASNI